MLPQKEDQIPLINCSHTMLGFFFDSC